MGEVRETLHPLELKNCVNENSEIAPFARMYVGVHDRQRMQLSPVSIFPLFSTTRTFPVRTESGHPQERGARKVRQGLARVGDEARDVHRLRIPDRFPACATAITTAAQR